MTTKDRFMYAMAFAAMTAMGNFMLYPVGYSYEVGQTIDGYCKILEPAVTAGGPESGVCAPRDVTEALTACQYDTSLAESFCTTELVDTGYVEPYGPTGFNTNWAACATALAGFIVLNGSIGVACAFACAGTFGVGCVACVLLEAEAAAVSGLTLSFACQGVLNCQKGSRTNKQPRIGCM